MNTVLNRPALKAQARELLRTAQVSPKAFMVLYYSVLVLLDVLISFLPSEGLAGMFITTLSELFSWVLGAGLVLYFMGIRRRERMEFATLFDGFSFAGKLIALNLVVNAFTALWSLLPFTATASRLIISMKTRTSASSRPWTAASGRPGA